MKSEKEIQFLLWNAGAPRLCAQHLNILVLS